MINLIKKLHLIYKKWKVKNESRRVKSIKLAFPTDLLIMDELVSILQCKKMVYVYGNKLKNEVYYMNEIEIIDYEEKYKKDLQRLSYEWLEKYLYVEPEDIKILSNPKEVVLDNGGFIFFAKYDDEIIGTVSLIKVDENTFELAKLAVTENYKGLKISNKLMEKCLNVVKSNNATKIVLYTNNLLISAIALYKKYGFKEIPLLNNKYMGSDLKMELEL